MKISVIVCTYNRCDSLAKALRSVANCTLPESLPWEVLVVDNNSTDGTSAVVETLAREYPGRIRYVLEPRAGKSHALNTGIRESRGEIIAFMDDDVRVAPGWLHNLAAPLLDGRWIGSAGRVYRDWASAPPDWVAAEGRYGKMAWPLVSFDFGDQACELTTFPCGTNMAFRKEAFAKYGLFRIDLGPEGNELRNSAQRGTKPLRALRSRICTLKCEDTEFSGRLFAAGERMWYEPSAVVYHPVEQNRLSKPYFLQWWFNFGRGNGRMTDRAPVLGIPGRYFRIARLLFRLVARVLLWFTAFNSHRRFYYKALTWETAGVIFEDVLYCLGLRNTLARSGLRFRCGDWVEVRSKEEILRTLDKNGELEGMPFMPEMFAFCGKRFPVYKRAHKTCDTVFPVRGRRVHRTVHLQTRCDGSAHGGCQANCLLFWKEAWLKPAGANADAATLTTEIPLLQPAAAGCSEGDVWSNAEAADPSDGKPVYSCQATRLPYATTDLKWWDIRQYFEDYTSGNVGAWRMVCGLTYSLYYHLSMAGIGVGPAMRWFYNRFHRLWRGTPFPRTEGKIADGQPTPAIALNLQPGELVRVKSQQEILQTVNSANRNRGLYWDAEMVPYCGDTYPVARRVTRIIDERTGKMQEMKTPCIMLESVICQSRYSECRLFCPRSIYSYWREIWLERVQPAVPDKQEKSERCTVS